MALKWLYFAPYVIYFLSRLYAINFVMFIIILTLTIGGNSVSIIINMNLRTLSGDV